ncbi:MAG: hypothetical protein FWD73_13225 [Polyangiaceae bacterium]|nr:hypothetical protein [Polyangiaceae bacterium]
MRSLLYAALAIASLSVLVPTAAHAKTSAVDSQSEQSEGRERLSTGESTRLDRGETVVRKQTWELGSRHYVGGLTYTVVDSSAAELTSVLKDVQSYRRVLPRTKQARVVGEEGRDRLVEVVQGNALVEATYTMRIRNEPASPSGSQEIRFWLDPTRPHSISDAWGFFRLEPFVGQNGQAQVLLTYGVVVDIGEGIVRDLFEERVRSALLSVPQLVRHYVTEVKRPP